MFAVCSHPVKARAGTIPTPILFIHWRARARIQPTGARVCHLAPRFSFPETRGDFDPARAVRPNGITCLGGRMGENSLGQRWLLSRSFL
jgi:hypothetical protein